MKLFLALVLLTIFSTASANGDDDRWLGYVTQFIGLSQGKCDKVSIIGKDGSIRTTMNLPNVLQITPGEAKRIAEMVTGNIRLFVNGIGVARKKYFYYSDEGGILTGKITPGMGEFKDTEDAIVLYKSKTSIIIGHMQGRHNLNTAIASIAGAIDRNGDAASVSDTPQPTPKPTEAPPTNGDDDRWLGYVTQFIGLSQGKCDKVSIIGKDGSIRTTMNLPNVLQITPGEAKRIAEMVT